MLGILFDAWGKHFQVTWLLKILQGISLALHQLSGQPPFSLVNNTYVPIANPTVSKIGVGGGILSTAFYGKGTSNLNPAICCFSKANFLPTEMRAPPPASGALPSSWRADNNINVDEMKLEHLTSEIKSVSIEVKIRYINQNQAHGLVTSKKEWIERWNWCSYWV